MHNIKFSFVAGIDISKNTIDVVILHKDNSIKLFKKFKNTESGFKKMCNWIEQNDLSLSQVIFCAEKTGIYSIPLAKFMVSSNLKFWLEDGIKISKSEVFKRGKSDKVDAERIARYALRFQDNLKLYDATNETYEKMSHLYTLRERLLTVLVILQTALKESRGFIDPKSQKILELICSLPIKYMDLSVKRADKELQKLIDGDEEVKKKSKIVSSVRGVGQQTLIYLLIVTRGFEKIKTAKKCSCFGGIAPFEYTSGSSVRGKTRISHMGDKKLKKLLHMGVISIINQKKGEEYEYYLRKVSEGKPKMKVINALRNKILGRVYACIREDRKYLPELKLVS